MMKKTISAVLIIQMIASPVLAQGVPRIPGFGRMTTTNATQVAPPPVNALPQLRGIVQGVDKPAEPVQNRLEIVQNQEKAIIEWDSFNIGSAATVYFNQRSGGVPQTNWVALNRIDDANPSLIFGKLLSDGKVYLINQNGILFGNGSQVNVGALVASSLNMSNADFLNNTMKFKSENYQNDDAFTGPGAVINRGAIRTGDLGSVFFMGSDVENSGRIDAPLGQIGLIAGEEVNFSLDPNAKRQYFIDVPTNPGNATNTGTLSGDGKPAVIGLYGKTVNQNGVIRSVTTVRKGGIIELMASDKIATGVGSSMVVDLSDSQETTIQQEDRPFSTVTLTGLIPTNPLDRSFGYVPVTEIEHLGQIVATGGHVTLGDAQHIRIGTSGSIDTSGAWVDKAADANQIKATLTSTNLADDFGQKDGFLKNKDIKFDAHQGSAIGIMDGYLTSQEKTTREQYVKGGDIYLQSTQGDINVETGSSLSFAGGGTHYAGGSYATTVLYSKGRRYRISEAPQWLKYDRIGEETTYHKEHFEGADAGTLSIVSNRLLLAGTLNGSVRKGLYQTKKADPVDSFGRLKARGWKTPVGGSVILGVKFVESVGAGSLDAKIGNVVITASADPLAANKNLDGSLITDTSYVWASTLSSAGLSDLEIYSNTIIKTEQGSRLTLLPGGTFRAYAREIDHEGAVVVPSGTVDFTTHGNITSFADLPGSTDPNPRYVTVDERLFLGGGSEISTAGEVIDNSRFAFKTGARSSTAYIGGGTVSLRAITYHGQMIASAGSRINAGGGFLIDETGKITGGDAGTISLMGYTLLAGGELKALAMAGKKGGTLKLYAGNVAITGMYSSYPRNFTANSPLPVEVVGKLSFSPSSLEPGGFSNVEVNSEGDLTIGSGVTLAPSRTRMKVPIPGKSATVGTMDVSDDFIGASSVKVSAGSSLTLKDVQDQPDIPPSNVTIARGATLKTAPGGEIAVSGKEAISIAGTLAAPAGKISVTTKTDDGTAVIRLQDGAQLLAAGYNQQDTTPIARGYALGYTPMDGGTVALEGYDLNMEKGARIDVSGSTPVQSFIRAANGKIVSRTVAGAPGSLSLTFAGNAAMDADFQGNSLMGGLKGGSLSILKKDDVSALTLSALELSQFLAGGFDAFSFTSRKGLAFSGNIDFLARRSVTLDAPEIDGDGTDQLHFAAPYVRVANSYGTYLAGRQAGTGNATLVLSGDWLDVDGSVFLSGFRDLRADFRRDIRLLDRAYINPQDSKEKWEGRLEAAGDLILKADRIYPAMHLADAKNPQYGFVPSDFTVKAGGNITTLPADAPGGAPIYSAGGSLTVDAGGDIDHYGVLAAPMGTVTLKGGETGRVYLADGSRILAGAAGVVNYGAVDGVSWFTKVKGSESLADVTGAPERKVAINGNEVIIRDGATIDVSGGGQLYGYLFQKGIEGTGNPLDRAGRFVIMPDSGMQQPGAAVYLSGGPGLQAGVYSVLPVQYAFLPGAMVVTDLGKSIAPGDTLKSQEGYTVVAGYDTFNSTGIGSSRYKQYEVRPAADVLREGNFTIGSLTAGDAGAVSIVGNSTVLGGTISANPLAGFAGGTLLAAGKNISVQSAMTPLPDGFGPSTPLPDSMRDKLVVSADFFKGKGLREIGLGDADKTETITVTADSRLEAPQLTLTAKNDINIEQGSQLKGVGAGKGEVVLTSPGGTVTIGDNALVQADSSLSLDVNNLNLRGSIKADNATLNLTGSNVTLAQDGAAPTDGIFLTKSQWDSVKGANDIHLRSRNSVTFQGDFAMDTKGDMTIDAGRIASDGGARSISVAARQLTLKNSGAAVDATSANDAASLNVTAGGITAAGGDVRFDGFSAVALNSTGDLTLSGKGSVKTEGDLALTSARLTTSNLRDSFNRYQVADYSVESGGKVTIASSGGVAGTTTTPGGILSVKGKSIDQSGLVQVEGGRVNMNATGTDAADSITLHDGAAILAKGTIDTPGGGVLLEAKSGKVSIDGASQIDVSAGAQGDAGEISLRAANGGVELNGTIKAAAAQGGAGGSFVMDTKQIDDLAPINTRLADGGFTKSIDIRTRSGNLAVASGQTVKAGEIRLAADGGALDVQGTVDASTAANGGHVELYAGNDVTVRNGGNVKAIGNGAGADGGTVSLASANGFVTLEQGGTMTVSGNGGKKGTVTVTAARTGANNDVQTHLGGTIKDADRVDVVGMKVEADYATDKTIKTTDMTPWFNSATSFTANAGTMRDRLVAEAQGGVSADNLHIRSGIEVRGKGDLTLGDILDLSSKRYNGEAGVLVLRAANNLAITKNLVDHPTASLYNLTRSSALPSWDIGLVAGADTTGASAYSLLRGLDTGKGKLSIADNTVVYSETGAIRFASAGDTSIGKGAQAKYMIYDKLLYTLATYSGSIRGTVGGNAVFNGGTIQSAVGDISLKAGGDVTIAQGTNDLGSIRTTGEKRTAMNDYYNYGGGGSINLDVAGAIDLIPTSGLLAGNWDYAYTNQFPKVWGASYSGDTTKAGDQATKGIAAMAGGNVTVRAGKSFASQIGTFGKGDLKVYSGGDMAGRFLVRDGVGELHALGSFAPKDPAGLTDSKYRTNANRQVIEIFDAPVSVTAQGDLLLGTALNPTLANSNSGLMSRWNMTYGPRAAVSLISRAGDVTMTGDSFFVPAAYKKLGRLLPASVSIASAKNVSIVNDYMLAPATDRTFRVIAGGNIIGSNLTGNDTRAWIQMPDVNPGDFTGTYKPQPTSSPTDVLTILGTINQTVPTTYQATGAYPVEIRAGVASPDGKGNLENFGLYLTKKAIIDAEGDIKNIYFFGQNREEDDTTVIRAGGDIKFNSLRQGSLANVKADTGIIQGGPGDLLVQSGGSIDLGTTQGIQAVGNKWNQGLPEKGSNITVAAGFPNPPASYAVAGERFLRTDAVAAFLDQLLAVGNFYSNQLANGNRSEAQRIVDEAKKLLTGLKERYHWTDKFADKLLTDVSDYLNYLYGGILDKARRELIRPLVGDGSKIPANINMTSSEISSSSGSNINIVSNGAINVGKTAGSDGDSDNTGIYTSAGGNVNIYARNDVNVNESRIMSFMGGDIFTWSDYGNINAGKGSRTAISTDPPKVVPITDSTGKVTGYELRFTPPKLGSGYRAVTYDPDGPEGPRQQPEAGNIVLVAPSGNIDAGEAGISGNNVNLAAANGVLNAQNITAIGGTVGAPSAETTVSLGSLSGASSLAESNKMIEQTASMGSARDEMQKNAAKVDQLMAGWLDVKVISFDSEKTDDGKDKKGI